MVGTQPSAVPVCYSHLPAACRHVSLAGRKGAAALSTLPPASWAHLPPLPLHPASDTYMRKIQWTMKVR